MSGLYRKYKVTRTDGSSRKGRKHEDCAYFVLDLEHDPFAIPALEAYANACRETEPDLAKDIETIIDSGNGSRFAPNAKDMAIRIMGNK